MDSKEIKQKKSTSKIIKETVKKVSDKTKVKETAKKVTSKSKKEIESTGLEAPKKLKILVTIVERSKSDFYLSALEGFDVNMQTLVYAKGTASKEIAGLVGLNDDNKAMILSIVKEEKIKENLVKQKSDLTVFKK